MLKKLDAPCPSQSVIVSMLPSLRYTLFQNSGGEFGLASKTWCQRRPSIDLAKHGYPTVRAILPTEYSLYQRLPK